MERLTEYELEKYETILKQIEDEHTNYQAVQHELASLTNSLRVMKVLTNPEFAREKLFQVRIKLFNSTYEFSKVFPERYKQHELEQLTKTDASIYYCIEIFVSETFHKKLIKQAWIFNITIRNGQTCVSRSLNIKNRFSNPFCMLVPFEINNELSYVDVYLASPASDNYWPLLKLASIDVDVSYRWDSYNQLQCKETVLSDVVKIDRSYNPDAAVLELKSRLMRYQFDCNWSQKKFVEVILKNSYHKLDLSKILSIIGEDVKVKVNLDGNLGVIELDRALKVLKVEASAGDLSRVKEYLRKFGEAYTKKDFGNAVAISQLKDASEELNRNLKYNQPGFHELLNIYDIYLKFIGSYPL